MRYAYNGPRWVYCTEDHPEAVLVAEDAPPTPTGYRYSQEALIDVDGRPMRLRNWSPYTLADLIAEKQIARQAVFDAKVAAGFPCILDGVPETLQVRNADDKTNWLTFKDACRDGVDAGQGNQASGLPIRCTSNVEHVVTNNFGISLMNSLRAWVAGTMQHNWSLADEISAAADETTLNSIDLEAGWP